MMKSVYDVYVRTDDVLICMFKEDGALSVKGFSLFCFYLPPFLLFTYSKKEPPTNSRRRESGGTSS